MKNFTIGMLFGLILTFTSVSFANSEVVAKFTNFNFMINGETVTLETIPLVVEGRSYLPLRELSVALGYDVDYDNETRTILLDNQETENDNGNKSITAIMGETATVKDVNITINKTEQFVKYEDNYLRIYMTIENNSETPLNTQGRLQYKLLDDIREEDRLNKSGYSIVFDDPTDVYPGETLTGYIEYHVLTKPVEIEEIHYYLQMEGYQPESPGIIFVNK